MGIATNADGQFIIADDLDKSVKVFDSSGKFVLQFHPESNYTKTGLRVFDVATDVNNSNIYVLVWLGRYGAEREVKVFSHTADLLHKFPVRGEVLDRLAVTNNKVLVLTGWKTVHVYEHEGRYVRSFPVVGEILKFERYRITAGPDGQIMTLDGSCVFIFTEDGEQQRKFNINTKEDEYRCIAWHPSGEFVVVAGRERVTKHSCVAIYTKDGEFVRRIVETKENIVHMAGITVSMEGHIAVAIPDFFPGGKVIVL